MRFFKLGNNLQCFFSLIFNEWWHTRFSSALKKKGKGELLISYWQIFSAHRIISHKFEYDDDVSIINCCEFYSPKYNRLRWLIYCLKNNNNFRQLLVYLERQLCVLLYMTSFTVKVIQKLLRDNWDISTGVQ